MYHGETKNSNERVLDAKQSPNKLLSYDYIRGLVDGEGCFTFCTNRINRAGGEAIFKKIPTFAIRMHVRDKELIEKVKATLGLNGPVYVYKPSTSKDGYKRDNHAVLMARNIGELKNIIVPFFYKRLVGFKGKQFVNWLEKIGDDPDVSEGHKLIYRLYKAGYYDKNPKFI